MMCIQALPQMTVRILGASQVLTDPIAVVKELVDNGLDAHATSVVIEISSNTLGSIQVRDNGHGIPPEDRPLVARPHCTSKIGCEEDLKDIGGTSLGFRGEALASVAEMSGSLAISTRIEGEQVATTLKINQAGEVIGQERASLPVGTTVKITDLIRSNPVRKQVALEAADKTLKRIKQLLQSYAFARPQVRLQLRVLKAKNDKCNWLYAPKPGGNAEDAAFKIVGAACAAACTWSVVEEGGYTIQAFLPQVDADPSKVSNIGAFVSVDGRPVTTSRGTTKQAMKIFKEALKKAGSSLQGSKELFLYMDVACPTGSYDANVEPAKDDVLFEDPEILLAAVRKLFDAVYPAQQAEGSSQARSVLYQRGGSNVASTPPTFLFAATQAGNDGLQGPDDLTDLFEPPNRRKIRSNMYGCDDEDLELLDARPSTGQTDVDFEEVRKARRDVTLSNPWVMAKMNSSVRPLVSTNIDGTASRTQQQLLDFTPNDMPTPGPSSPPSSIAKPFRVPDIVPSRDTGGEAAMMLPPPQPYISPMSRMHSEADIPFADSPLRQAPMYDYSLPGQADPPTDTPIPAIRRKQAPRAEINKPHVSPFGDKPQPEKVWFDFENMDNRRSSQKKRRGGAAHSGLVRQGDTSDFQDGPRPLTPPPGNRDMRDYLTSGDDIYASVSDLIESRNFPEHRHTPLPDSMRPSSEPDYDDENGILRIRNEDHGFVRASELEQTDLTDDANESPAKHPPKRRRTGEARVLREVSHNAGSIDQEYRPGTEHHTSSRRQRTADGNKASRTKSSRLPLERVPAGQGTHDVSIRLSTTSSMIAKLARNINQDQSMLRWHESATSHTYDGLAAPEDSQEVVKLAEKLRELLINRVPEREMVQDLEFLVSNALAAQTIHEVDAL